MNRVRAVGVPLWVTAFATLMGVLGLVVGVVALLDPSSLFFTEADDALGRRWAGRQLGLGIVTLGAVSLRSRSVYILAVVAGIARELGDLAAAITDGVSAVPAVAFTIVGVAAVAHIAVLTAGERAGSPRTGTRPGSARSAGRAGSGRRRGTWSPGRR